VFDSLSPPLLFAKRFLLSGNFQKMSARSSIFRGVKIKGLTGIFDLFVDFLKNSAKAF
jgi:hypothetical protein